MHLFSFPIYIMLYSYIVLKKNFLKFLVSSCLACFPFHGEPCKLQSCVHNMFSVLSARSLTVQSFLCLSKLQLPYQLHFLTTRLEPNQAPNRRNYPQFIFCYFLHCSFTAGLTNHSTGCDATIKCSCQCHQQKIEPENKVATLNPFENRHKVMNLSHLSPMQQPHFLQALR